MAVVGKVRGSYLVKMGGFAVLLFAYAGWCVYDGLVVYPEHNRRFAAYAHFQDEKTPPHYTPTGEADGWDDPTTIADFVGYDDYPAYARAQGWDTATPGGPKTHTDIMTQWGQAGIAGLIGLFMAGLCLKRLGTCPRADEQTFSGIGGKQVPYAAVRSIDKARWESKGIAVVHYERDGRSGSVTIDDYIYERGVDVLGQIEAQSGVDGLAQV